MLQINDLSYWESKNFFKNVDLAIVGAGIVGYSCALNYRKLYPNANILILERGYLPSGASTKNAGFACFGSPTELLDDLKHQSEEKVLEILELRWRGLEKLREIIGDKNLKYQGNGSWDLLQINSSDSENHYIKWSEKLNYLNKLVAKICKTEKVFELDENVQSNFGFSNWNCGLKNNLEGQIDTASMMNSFHKKTIEQNCNTLFGIELQEFEDNNGNVLLKTNIGEITVKKLAICTNGFTKKLFPELNIEPARAQVLITKEIPNLKLKGTFHFNAGYYYFRNIDNRILFGGGRNLDFETENTDQFNNTDLVINKLKEILTQNILPNQPFEIEQTWSGIMGVGSDKNPIVEKYSDNIALGVKMGGMGIAIGSLIGEKVSGLLGE